MLCILYQTFETVYSKMHYYMLTFSKMNITIKHIILLFLMVDYNTYGVLQIQCGLSM